MPKFRHVDKLSTIISALECGNEREQAIALQFEQAWASFRPIASHFANLTTLQHQETFQVWANTEKASGTIVCFKEAVAAVQEARRHLQGPPDVDFNFAFARFNAAQLRLMEVLV